MLREYSVFFPGGTAKFGDWATFYFSLCLQDLAPGLEHRGPSKSVCGCTNSQEGCRQCVYSPQIVMRVGLLLTSAMPSLFRNRPSTPRPDGWDSRPGSLWGLLFAVVEGPFCTSGLCTWPLSNGHTHLSLLGTGGEPWAGRRNRALLLTRVSRCPSVTHEE